jgi:hypothetical protein
MLMTLPRLTREVPPTYEADDGPLSACDLKALVKIVAATLPQGQVVGKQALF